MANCTFFGHSDCPSSVKADLRNALIDLIEHHEVDMFYVGNNGTYDRIVRTTLKELQSEYTHIRYAVVLARLPGKVHEYDDYSDTMLPEGIESVPPRFAISWRNKWMLQQSDFVVTFITRTWGGAAQFADIAKRQNKTVIELSKSQSDNK